MPLQAKIILFFQANKLAGRQAEQIGAGQVRLQQRVAPRKHGHTDRSARDVARRVAGEHVCVCLGGKLRGAGKVQQRAHRVNERGAPLDEERASEEAP